MIPEANKEAILKLRRKLFDKYYSSLNSEQREAVHSVNGPLLILAGAGSGKTTVLVKRIENIIRFGNLYESKELYTEPTDFALKELEEACDGDDVEKAGRVLEKYAVNPVPAWAIMCITFTNKAANEMKSRLAVSLGEEKAGEIWAGTFHSICLRVLRKFIDQSEYDSGFTIYDTDDSKKLISEIIKEKRLDEKLLKPRSVLSAISRAKDHLQTPDDFRNNLKQTDFTGKMIAGIFEEYEDRLRKANAMDFDNIIVSTVKLLKGSEEAREYCQNRFKYVCVDEFQDTNPAQFELIKLLCGRFRNIMVVGDDDQSIYRFRGATIENILGFDEYYPDAKVVKLEKNYRSTSNILGAANSVIANNSERHDKTLQSTKENGEPVSVYVFDTQEDEARFIADTVLSGKDAGKSFNDFAVLYRMNAQSNRIENALARSGIPYKVFGGQRFYDRKEIKDIIAYLCLIVNHNDNLRLKRIINEPKRAIGRTTVDTVEYIAAENGISMFEVMERAKEFTALSRSADKLLSFVNIIKTLEDLSRGEGPAVVVENTLKLTGYKEMLVQGGKETADKLENVSELVTSATQYQNENEEGGLRGFLEEIALVSDIDNYSENSDSVSLMTMHCAKGLEFDTVFLPGFEEGVFPGFRSIFDESEIEEERRLAYVGITRAETKLYVTRVRQRMLNGMTSYNQPSRFLDEMDERYFETVDRTGESELGYRKKTDFPTRTAGRKDYNIDFGDTFDAKPPAAVSASVRKRQPFVKFGVGERAVHRTFGEGTILSAKDLGGDVLYEIAFDEFGTKKLMATFAKLKRPDESDI